MLESVERYCRLEPDHPNRVLVESLQPIGRIKQQSPMDIALQLHDKHILPQNRLLTQNYSTIPPWKELKSATIRCSLLDPSIDKSSNPTILRTCALETIDSYHDVQIHAYTDGSALDGTSSAGCGAFIKFPGRPDIDISEACGKTCSNYDAEIQG